MTVNTMPASPTKIGTRTAGLCHGYLLPPQLKPTRNKVELVIMSRDPVQSTAESLWPIVIFWRTALSSSVDVARFAEEDLSPVKVSFVFASSWSVADSVPTKAGGSVSVATSPFNVAPSQSTEAGRSVLVATSPFRVDPSQSTEGDSDPFGTLPGTITLCCSVFGDDHRMLVGRAVLSIGTALSS